MIKEEKQNTEMRAEELESRVNNLDLNDDATSMLGQAYMKQANSPVNSGRSTPSQTKSDLFKLNLAKNKDNYKSMTVSFSKHLILFSSFLIYPKN